MGFRIKGLNSQPVSLWLEKPLSDLPKTPVGYIGARVQHCGVPRGKSFWWQRD